MDNKTTSTEKGMCPAMDDKAYFEYMTNNQQSKDLIAIVLHREPHLSKYLR